MLINDNASTNTATSTNDAPKPEPTNSSSNVTKESAVRLIENLVNERQQWQEAVYKTSNDMLYGLLQRCYGLYSTMCEKNNDGKAAREGFGLYLQRNKLAFKKGTHTLTMIVRCVFGTDRRRVSAYSIVLRRALADGIKPFDLPAFIRNAGGVEEVRLAKSPTVLTPKQRSDIAAAHVDKGVLATVKAEALSKCLDLAKTGERLVLIATQQADGEVIINAVIKSDSVLTAALSSYYSDNKRTWKESEASAATQSKQDQLGDSIEEAVQKQLAA
jgi:hypothetical protein